MEVVIGEILYIESEYRGNTFYYTDETILAENTVKLQSFV
jgi:hypothetical protein